MAFITFQPSDYFNTKLWTGDGTTSNAQTGIGFQPDLVWTKGRSNAYDNTLTDAVRGATKYLISNSTNAEATGNIVTSFDSDGFTLGNRGEANNNNSTYVAWNWRANGSGSSNTDGSVSSTVSASTTSGFSIVKYTNPSSGSPFTVGHGLGVAPKMIIIKNLSAAQTWGVWHTGLGFGNYLRLDTSAASAAANLVTATSSTTFSSYYDHHTAGNELIAYCFADKKGFSKFSTYVGNGSADGTFVYTGFKPAFSIIKRTSGTYNWPIRDNKRETFNPLVKEIYTDASDAEITSASNIDFLSNGFKIRNTSGTWNGSGSTYIYMAFAEFPFVGSNDIPGVAS